jgi:ClpP class serine protease
LVPNLEAYYEKEGIKVEVIAAGIYKAAGAEGLALTEDQRRNLTESVYETRDTFRRQVRNKRAFVKDEDMEGQVFTGREAASRGLATGIAPSLKAALASF